MFEFAQPQPRAVVTYLDGYLARPAWNHAVHMMPLLAALDGRRRLPFWTARNLEPEVIQHLTWSLREWSAFRGSDDFDATGTRLAKKLPGFLKKLQECAPAERLARVGESKLDGFVERVCVAFDGFQAVKGVESYVLPSKAAHLMLPTLIPAYDVAVVVGEVLAYLLPMYTRAGKSYATYMKLCWWVIQRLDGEGGLKKATALVRDHLLGTWLVRQLSPKRPRASSAILNSLDSTVAEYTLIAMARAVKEKSGPGDRNWKPLIMVV
jgi:hypothetical protein